jgi:hypothetical protein
MRRQMANWRFNADANTGHGFAIFMASVGALRASRSGAAELGVRLFERGTLVTSAKKKSSSENRTFKLEGWLPIALFAGLIFIGFIAALIIPSTS